MITEINVETIEEYNEITSTEKTLVLSYAPWCKGCKIILPLLEEISDFEEMNDIKFYKMLSDKHKKIISYIGVKAIPVMLLYQNGIELKRKIGLLTEEELIIWINSNIKR